MSRRDAPSADNSPVGDASALSHTRERAEFWREHRPSEVYVFRTRPSFRELYEDGTVGRLRKRDRDTGEVVTKGGKPVLVGCDSCAYGCVIQRTGRAGPDRSVTPPMISIARCFVLSSSAICSTVNALTSVGV